MLICKVGYSIPANFFWHISVRFYPQSFPKIPEEVRSLPKTSEVCRRRSYQDNTYPQNQRSRGRYCHLVILHMVFSSLHGSELTYFWKLCQARRQQLTFFNQAWEIGPQAWDRSFQPAGVRLTPKAWELAGIRGCMLLSRKKLHC